MSATRPRMLEFLYEHIDIAPLQEITYPKLSTLRNYNAHINQGTEGRGIILTKAELTEANTKRLPSGRVTVSIINGTWIINTRWFKYDRDWFVKTYKQISPGHIWTTLYIRSIRSLKKDREVLHQQPTNYKMWHALRRRRTVSLKTMTAPDKNISVERSQASWMNLIYTRCGIQHQRTRNIPTTRPKQRRDYTEYVTKHQRTRK